MSLFRAWLFFVLCIVVPFALFAAGIALLRCFVDVQAFA